MKCPTCEANGVESRMVFGKKRIVMPSRAVNFCDEDGSPHHHDLYSVVTPMECSEGHKWEHHSKSPCETCGMVVDPKGTDRFGRPV